jgi:hypothetical protein
MVVVRAIPKVCPICGNDKPPEYFVPWWRKAFKAVAKSVLGLIFIAGGARNGRRGARP